jgi:hypothetical protein
MLCGCPLVQKAAISNCLPFDPFPFDQYGLASPEVDVGGRQVADSLMISQMIVIGDEGLDLGFEIAWQGSSSRARSGS